MIGHRLGCWVLERELGRGGMGEVYLARREGGDHTLPDRAAVKVLAGFLGADEGARVRFQREIDVLEKLSHPNIVHFLGAGEVPGFRYYAMEYVEGPSYETILAERQKLPWPEVLDAGLQICLALKHAHAHGIIHRDLKPSNLLRASPDPDNPFGFIKLTDFGIAWVFAGEHLTVTGAVVGTPEYLSPEQAAGKTPTKKSDLYSLGIVLYTLLVGKPPFTGEPIGILHKHRYGQFERISRLVSDVPHDFEQVICELLEKEPDRRPPDAGVLHRKLDSLRRKYERKADQNTMAGFKEDTSVENGQRPSKTGPATMMAQLMREELTLQQKGGPVQRFFNHPAVLLILLAVIVGLIVWAFLPPSAEKLFERGSALMKSNDPADWELAWDSFLSKLKERHPDFRPDEVDAFRRKAEAATEKRLEQRDARLAGSMSEEQWFYEKGMRLMQQGKQDEAERVWKQLIAAFGDADPPSAWVERARLALKGNPVKAARTGEERWTPVRKALEEAQRLDRGGKPDEAKRIRAALEALYRDDPSAREVLGKGNAP